MAKKGVARQMTNSVPSTPRKQRSQERTELGMASSIVKISFRIIVGKLVFIKTQVKYIFINKVHVKKSKVILKMVKLKEQKKC